MYEASAERVRAHDVIAALPAGLFLPHAMSLHGHPVLESAELPDGRAVEIRVGIAQDPYIADRELNTVSLELRIGGRVEAVVNTILDAEQELEARKLADAVAAGLSSGELEPTAGAIEPLADELL